MFKKLSFIICALALVFFACSSTKGGSKSVGIKGVEWKLVSIKDKNSEAQLTPKGEKIPTLKIEADDSGTDRASGLAGCNRYSSSLTLSGSSIKFGAAVATRMFCIENMDIEDAMLDAIAQTDAYAIKDGKLMLMKGSSILATFTK
ncbi:hypothetical protein AwDysgo_15290 [Bacteroidales bacterium]|nr:hypothetical protein AwDysgo_15290 [Bacteroidales bacterium]